MWKAITITAIALLSGAVAFSQARIVTGKVLDSATRLPVPNVSVTLAGAGRGTLTGAAGTFLLPVSGRAPRLRFTAAGYSPVTVLISDTVAFPMTVLMSVSYTALQQVVVNNKKRYRNRNNPAVALIRQVIAHKASNAPASCPFLSYQQYDKIRVLADRPPRFIADGKLFRRYHFLFTPDTTLVPGKRLVPLYLEESWSRHYQRGNPSRQRAIILARKRVDLGEYIDMSGVSAIMNRLYEDCNVYDNTMMVFTLQFMSPVAELGPDLYEYFIRDTVIEEGNRTVRLDFQPRNPQDLLFKGVLYITLDGDYAIRRADLEASNHSNVNWVRNFSVSETFDKGPGGRYYRRSSGTL